MTNTNWKEATPGSIICFKDSWGNESTAILERLEHHDDGSTTLHLSAGEGRTFKDGVEFFKDGGRMIDGETPYAFIAQEKMAELRKPYRIELPQSVVAWGERSLSPRGEAQVTLGSHYAPQASKFLLKSYQGDPGDNPRFATWEVYDTLEDAQEAAQAWQGAHTPGDTLEWTHSGLSWHPRWEGIYANEYTDPTVKWRSDPRWVVEEIPYVPRRNA